MPKVLHPWKTSYAQGNDRWKTSLLTLSRNLSNSSPTNPHNVKQSSYFKSTSSASSKISSDAFLTVHELVYMIPGFVWSITTFPDLSITCGHPFFLDTVQNASVHHLSYDTTFSPELIRGHAIASRIREPYDPPRGFRLYFDPPRRSAPPRGLGSPKGKQVIALCIANFDIYTQIPLYMICNDVKWMLISRKRIICKGQIKCENQGDLKNLEKSEFQRDQEKSRKWKSWETAERLMKL